MNKTLQILIADLKDQHAACINAMQSAMFEKNVISIAGECRGIQAVITGIRFSQKYTLTEEDRRALQELEANLRAEQNVAQGEAYDRILNTNEHLNREAANDDL